MFARQRRKINRVKDIDDAIQSRISVALHYEPLGLDTRKTLWESFLVVDKIGLNVVCM